MRRSPYRGDARTRGSVVDRQLDQTAGRGPGFAELVDDLTRHVLGGRDRHVHGHRPPTIAHRERLGPPYTPDGGPPGPPLMLEPESPAAAAAVRG